METIFRSIAGIGKQIRAIGMVSYYMKLIFQLLNFYLIYYWNHTAIALFNLIMEVQMKLSITMHLALIVQI